MPNQRVYLEKKQVYRQQLWQKACHVTRFTNNTRICAWHFISGHPACFEAENDVDWIPTVNLNVVPLGKPVQTAQTSTTRCGIVNVAATQQLVLDGSDTTEILSRSGTPHGSCFFTPFLDDPRRCGIVNVAPTQPLVLDGSDTTKVLSWSGTNHGTETTEALSRSGTFDSSNFFPPPVDDPRSCEIVNVAPTQPLVLDGSDTTKVLSWSGTNHGTETTEALSRFETIHGSNFFPPPLDVAATQQPVLAKTDTTEASRQIVKNWTVSAYSSYIDAAQTDCFMFDNNSNLTIIIPPKEILFGTHSLCNDATPTVGSAIVAASSQHVYGTDPMEALSWIKSQEQVGMIFDEDNQNFNESLNESELFSEGQSDEINNQLYRLPPIYFATHNSSQGQTSADSCPSTSFRNTLNREGDTGYVLSLMRNPTTNSKPIFKEDKCTQTKEDTVKTQNYIELHLQQTVQSLNKQVSSLQLSLSIANEGTRFSIATLARDDKKCRYFTGLSCGSSLKKLYEALFNVIPCYDAISKEQILILTLRKIRLNEPFSTLSYLYNLHPTTISNYFYETVHSIVYR